MTLAAAAVLPHPPLVVPELAAGAAPELDDLRAAMSLAVDAVVAAGATRLVLVGGAAADEVRARSFAPWGLDAPVPVDDDLPLSLLVGAWLLARQPTRLPARHVAVAAGLPPRECAALGAELAGGLDAVGLLVLGDGSARRGPSAPRRQDPRADAFDAAVAQTLAAADAAALLAVEPALAAELAVAGRAAWQVLAGAAGERRYAGRLLYDAAPYGVGYLVATWTPA